MFDSIYSIALDILDKVHGQVRQFDSSYSIALAILDQIGGDTTKKFDSVYSILKEIYKQRFGTEVTNMDSAYSIAEAINHALDDTDNRRYDSTYSILLHVDENPALLGKRFRIITDPANTVIINGRHTREDYFEEGDEVTWSVSNARDHYIEQSGTYTMGDEDYDLTVTLVREQYTVTITPDPVDATVTINGQAIDTLTADWGTTINWSVSKEHYVTQTGTLILQHDEDLDVTLSLEQFTFTVDTDPSNSVTINNRPRTSFTAPYGTEITWVVQRVGYTTQSGSATLVADHTEYVTLSIIRCTFSINPTPIDATVLINDVEQSSITVDYGSSISWSVSATGYVTQTGTTAVTTDVTLPVSLALQTHTFTIVPVPADSTVIINGQERTSLTASYGTVMTWSVSHTGYQTQSGTETLTETYSMPINLAKNNYLFEIECTPQDATVVINGQERTSITAPYETEITWSVSASHYITQSGSYTLLGDHYETVTLARDNHTLTIVPTPQDATVVIEGEQRTTYTAVHGTVASYSVSRTGYATVSSTYTMDQDATIPVSLTANNYTVNITTNVSEPTITWTVGGTTTTGSSVTAPYGSSVTYEVSKTGYQTQTGTFTMTQDDTISITMVLQQFTFSIVTDQANTVMINGVERTSLTADYNTAITWSVSRTHYVTETGSYTLTSDHTETVTLSLVQCTLTINPTPADSTVTIDGVIQSSKTVDYGTLVDYEVSHANYTTTSVDDYPVTQTETVNVSLTPVNYTITFDVTPNTATIAVDGTTLSGSTFTGAYGSSHTYVITEQGYETVTSSFTIAGNDTITVVMQSGPKYLTFDVVADGDIYWNKSGTNSNIPSRTIEYNKNGAGWVSITPDQNTPAFSVVTGDVVQFRGDNVSYGNSYGADTFQNSTAQIKVSGNIMSLIDSDDFANLTTLTGSYNFNYMFSRAGVVDIMDLELPATTLTDNCYNSLFSVNGNLHGVPSGFLPATVMASSCYMAMFSQCDLYTVPSDLLPATVLASSCYAGMLGYNFNLTNCPNLPATTLASSCYGTFCASDRSITTTPNLPATQSANGAYQSMFSGCSGITTVGTISLTDASSTNACKGMFSGCSSITTIPQINMSDLSGEFSCEQMFYQCTQLQSSPISTITAVGQRGCYQMYYGCTALTNPPVIRTGGFENNLAFYNTFRLCSNLDHLTYLSTDTLSSNHTDWLRQVKSSGVFTGIDGVNYTRGNSGVPTNWTLQTSTDYYAFSVKTNITATITINGVSKVARSATILVEPNDVVTWSASADGYVTQSGTYTVGSASHTEDLTMAPIQYTVTFNVVQSNPTITVNGQAISGNTYTGDYNSTVEFEISKTGYAIERNSVVLSSDMTVGPINLIDDDTESGYLTFDVNATCDIKLWSGQNSSPYKNVQYSTDGGTTWTTWYNSFNGSTKTFNAGDVIYFKSDNTSADSKMRILVDNTGDVYIHGNVASLLSGNARYNLESEALNMVFVNSTGLHNHPTKDIYLPSLNLGQHCYDNLFNTCSGITRPPKLPAAVVPDAAYIYMFRGSGITSIPDFSHVTSMGQQFYMFESCNSLTSVTIPDFGTSTSTMYYWFKNCTSLTSAVLEFDEFSGRDCCANLFYGCSNLNSVKCLASNPSTNYTLSWLTGVSSTGTFTKATGVTWPTGVSGIPDYWTVVEETPPS